jgi:hypothetical protein
MPYFARPVAGERDAQPSGCQRPVPGRAGQARSPHIIRETLDGRRAGQLLDAYEAG